MRTVAGYLSHVIEEFPVDPRVDLRTRRRRQLRRCATSSSVRTCTRSASRPYRSITEIEMAEGKRTTTSLDADRPTIAAADPSRGARVWRRRSSAATSAPTPPPACWPSTLRTKIGSWRSWTSAPTPNSSSAIATASWPRPARLARRSKAARFACGMPGLDGAIESVTINDDGNFSLGVIGDVQPDGNLRFRPRRPARASCCAPVQMNALGRFDDGLPRITLDDEHGIYLFESDVNELAQAKGANVAGLHTVFSQYGVAVRRRRRVLPGRRIRAASQCRRRQTHRTDPEHSDDASSSKSATPRSKALPSPCSRTHAKRQELEAARQDVSSIAGWKPIRDFSISSSKAASSSRSSPAARPCG